MLAPPPCQVVPMKYLTPLTTTSRRRKDRLHYYTSSGAHHRDGLVAPRGLVLIPLVTTRYDEGGAVFRSKIVES